MRGSSRPLGKRVDAAASASTTGIPRVSGRRSMLPVVLVAAVVVALLLVSMLVGSVAASPREFLVALRNVMNGTDHPLAAIVLELRLPRALLALLVGAGLGMAGALLQTATRNDLADPFLFGLSSGAAAGAVAVITTTGDWLGAWTLPASAFAGGLLAAGAVVALAMRVHDQGPERMVLAGLAVSFLFAAITNTLVFAGDQRAAHSVLFWNLGGLGLARWDNLWLAFLGVLALVLYGIRRRHTLDALLAGDDTAYSLGVSPARTRIEVLVVCAFSTAAFVALSGVIGFVGLMIPHLARAVAGPLHGAMLATCAALGGALLLASDIASRTLLAPQELPVGIVTGAVGALFVVRGVLRRAAA